MERKIGDTLEYKGTRLKVVEDPQKSCENCYFHQMGECNECNMRMSKKIGACDAWDRNDRKFVIYIKED